MRLDFVVPGFSKCGTTSLCSLLAKHPQVFIPEIKEPNFFAYNYHRGWEWYEEFFKDTGDAQMAGEGSTFYTAAEFEQRSSDRIKQYFPDARLIFIARNPIARLESSYREHHHSGRQYGIAVPFSIGRALKEFRNIIDDTLYWRRINAYRKNFPDSRIHVLFLEDLHRDPARELAACFEFLGVDSAVRIERANRKLNPGSDKLYDSRTLRFIRRHKWAERIWQRLPAGAQDHLARALGFRKPFKGPVKWQPADLDWAVEQVGDDARQFLGHYGKPSDFWRLVPRAVAA